MIIQSINVKNFRCLKNVEMACDNLTIMVGANGTGKSCMIKALEFFFKTDITYDKQDFYYNDVTEPIIISITFHQLTQNELNLFNSYLDGDTLTIVKEISHPPSRTSQRYYGSRLYNLDFDKFRSESGQGLRRAYEALRESAEYEDLPSYQNRELAESNLSQWEREHPEQCEMRRDDGQFFGFRNVGKARMERFTKFISIPAVYEAEVEATEGRGSIIKELMDIFVRASLRENPEYQRLLEATRSQYDEIFDPERMAELQRLEGELSESLQRFVSDSEVRLSWAPGLGLQIDPPQAFVDLVEDGFQTSIGRTGHGLQRAFLISMFQHLAVIQSTLRDEEENGDTSSLIVAIEEPELYQHPDRQRHFEKIITDLTSRGIPGVISSIQGFYCTHSPLMINPSRIDNIRIFRKIEANEGAPKITTITYTTLSEVASLIEEACEAEEGTYTAETLVPRLQAIMTPMMNESYFSKLVVLVEGIKDRAIILGTAAFLGHDFESIGISVIPCNGKCNIDRPLAIMKKLDIPYFVIWDSDEGKPDLRVQTNHELLHLLDAEIEDYPDRITESYSCFRTDFEQCLKESIGEDFIPIIREYCDEHGLDLVDPALNLPNTITRLLITASERGIKFDRIVSVVEHIYMKYQDSQ